MADVNLKGLGVALITPFNEDESIDYVSLGRLVDYLLKNGADYLVVLGTSAETPTLTEEEKRKVLNLVLEHVHGRVPIVLGVGGNCTRNVIEQLHTFDFLSTTNLLRRGSISISRLFLKLRNFRSSCIMFQDVPA